MGLLCNLQSNYDRTIRLVVVNHPPPPPQPPPTQVPHLPQLQPSLLLPPSSSQVYPVKHMSYSFSPFPLPDSEESGTSKQRKGTPSFAVPVSRSPIPPHSHRDSSPTDALHGFCECLGSQSSGVNTKMPKSEEGMSPSDRRLHEDLTVRSTSDMSDRNRLGPQTVPWGNPSCSHMGQSKEPMGFPACSNMGPITACLGTHMCSRGMGPNVVPLGNRICNAIRPAIAPLGTHICSAMGPTKAPFGTHICSGMGPKITPLGTPTCSKTGTSETPFSARKSAPRSIPCESSPRPVPSGPSSLLTTLLLCLLLAGGAEGSEFPDRECCDSVPPPPPHYHQATSTTTTTTPTPLIGHNASIITVSQGALGVINCIQAREQCNNDPSCRDVLKMLHKICGPELVACATVTPGKCRTLLKTLEQFEYLRTCSCGEPHMDFTCYTFRETIFNHPCSRTSMAVGEIQDFMPTCTDAEQECRNQNFCLKIFMEFITECSFSGYTCTTREMESCNKSWRKVRNSPLFGCVCSAAPPTPRTLAFSTYDRGIVTEQQQKELTCMIAYNRTHHNPCLDGQKSDLQRVEKVESSQAMCHIALENCVQEDQCRIQLDKIMLWCEHAHCEPDRCRIALQEFYQRVSVMRRLQVAFCVCRQSDPDGECLTAMRKLHPTCAERQPGRDPLKCHKIAEQCRTNPACRYKLQEYEEKCAADAMTGRCSHTYRNCQQAVMNILGTELHATCVCKGTDFLHQHDCYTWQKLLWSNPCVIESHLELQIELSKGGGAALEEIFRSPHTTPAPPPIEPLPTDEEDPDLIHNVPEYGTEYGNVVYEPERPSILPRPSATYDRNRGSWAGRRPGGMNGGSGRNGGNGGGLVVGTGRGFPSRTENGRGTSSGGIDRLRFPDGVGVETGHREESSWVSRNPHRGPSQGIKIGGGHRNPNGNGGGWNNGRGNRYNPGQEGSYRPPGSTGGREPTNHRGTPINIGNERTGLGVGGGSGGGRGREDWGPGRRQPSWSRGGSDRTQISERFRPRLPNGEGEREGVSRPPSPYQPITPTHPQPSLPPIAATTSTTTTSTTTATPTRSCIVKDRTYRTVLIPESSIRRLYRGEKDCSVLCTCSPGQKTDQPLEASCTTHLCTGNKACNTTNAFYPHTAPYVQAHRGDCVCYAGKFICQKPEPSLYDLGTGIYLFLGYSIVEVNLLKPHTYMDELAALEVLRKVLSTHYDYKCTLEIKKHIGENFIMYASLILPPDQYLTPYKRQRREKEECAGPLEDLTKKINARPRNSDILTDAILSIFILAKVDVNYPEAQVSPSPAPVSPCPPLLTLMAALLSAHILVHWVGAALNLQGRRAAT